MHNRLNVPTPSLNASFSRSLGIYNMTACCWCGCWLWCVYRKIVSSVECNSQQWRIHLPPSAYYCNLSRVCNMNRYFMHSNLRVSSSPAIEVQTDLRSHRISIPAIMCHHRRHGCIWMQQQQWMVLRRKVSVHRLLWWIGSLVGGRDCTWACCSLLAVPGLLDMNLIEP